MKTTTPQLRNSINHSPLGGFLLIALTLAWFALSQRAQAEDGDLGNGNTAEGSGALFSLTTGPNNTAMGLDALYSNTTGFDNTANGFLALVSNTTGGANTAIGFEALASNTTGGFNTANGVSALSANTTGSNNTANGVGALESNTTGGGNTAIGDSALLFNNGSNNTAIGASALVSSGSNNIALGVEAGFFITGDNNIDIGNVGVFGNRDSGTIRIGTQGTQTRTFIAGIRETPLAHGVAVAVGITSDGQLGVRASSARFKEAIRPMEKKSEAILALQPVSFRYKKELDPKGTPQFGLVAEQVAKVDPDLVARDVDGRPYTVRYEEVNAMLLNEFLKEHRTVQEQQATITELKSTVAQQQQDMKVFAATLKEQASQIQKVSAQLEASKPAPRVVNNNQ